MAWRKGSTDEAIACIREGGVVVFPTETAYGLGCDATNWEAVERAARMKQRADGQVMALIVQDVDMARAYAHVDQTVLPFVEKHWPGPLTVVLPEASSALSPWCHKHGAVGMRVSSHPLAQAVVRGVGRPLVATSANLHGFPTCYTLDCVQRQFEEAGVEPDLVLDGGDLPEVPASMIIEMVNGEVIVHRPGSFKL